MLGFPPAIWFGGDSASYLSTALYHAPGTSRVSGYGVVLFVLKPFHSFAVVTAVQHLMGLAVGVMIYALLRRYGLPGWGRRWRRCRSCSTRTRSSLSTRSCPAPRSAS